MKEGIKKIFFDFKYQKKNFFFWDFFINAQQAFLISLLFLFPNFVQAESIFQEQKSSLIGLIFLFLCIFVFFVFYFTVKIKKIKKEKFNFENIANSADEGIVVVSIDGKFLYANKKIKEILGYSEGEVLKSENMEDVIHPEELNKIKERLKKRIKGESVLSGYIARAIKKDGSIIDTKVNASRIIWNGEAADLVIIHDVTEEKEREEKIKESEKRYKELYENNPDGFVRVDLNHYFLKVNKAFVDFFGYSEKELLGKKYDDITPKKWHKIENDIIVNQVLKRGYSDVYEKEYIKKDGTVIPIELRVFVEKDSSGKSVGMWAFVRDLSNRKNIEKVLLASEEKFSKMFYISPLMMLISTVKDGRFIDVNNSFLRVVGYSRDEVIGHTSLELNFLSRIKEREKFIKILKKEGRVLNEKVDIFTTDGEIRKGLLSSILITLQGEAHNLTIIEDVTERERKEHELSLSEDKFAKVFRSNPDSMIISTLKDGCYIEVNDSFLKATGYSRDEVIGKTAVDLKVWADPRQRDEFVKILKKQGYVHNFEAVFGKKSGATGIVLMSSEFIIINGDPCLLTISKDITDRKKAEEALSESEEKFSKAFKASPDAITISTVKDGRYIDINKKFTEITGYSKKETIGKTSLDLKIWAKPEEREQMVELFKEQGYVYDFEFTFGTKLGKTGIALMSVEPIVINGETCLLIVSRDVTEKKKMEETLRNSEKNLKIEVEKRTQELRKAQVKLLESEKLVALGKMASVIAHELRNPLGVIKLASYSLSKKIGEKDKKALSHIESIDKKVQEANKIITDMLTFSVAKKPELELGGIDKSIEKGLSAVEMQIKEKNIKIIKKLDSSLPKIYADFNQLGEVFVNLFSNSIQAMTDSKVKELKIVSREKDNFIEVEVRDTGCGISEENMKKLGQSFFSTKIKGIGLGLYIAYRIIARHNGIIEVKSKEGKGASFIVKLPKSKI